jgi:hypothetical protein
MSRLAEKIPKLAQRVLKNQPYLGESGAGLVPGYMREAEFRIHSRSYPDGSFVNPTDEARQTIETILRTDGWSPVSIQEALHKFDETKENEKVEIPGLEVKKWSIDKVRPDFSKNHLMSPLVPLKSAYEFLACLLGTAVCDDSAPLSEIKQALLSLNADCSGVRVDPLHAEQYEPFHGICFEGNNPHASVQIRLFGWLAFRVHFLRLAVSVPKVVYTHYLDSGIEHVQIIRA